MTRRILFIAEIGLRVKDLPRMVAFYQELLGFEIERAEPDFVYLKIGDLSSSLSAGGHPQRLALFDRPLEPISTLSALDHLTFEIPSDAYDEEKARLMKMGVFIKERPATDPLNGRGRAFFFRDPEDNIIELIAYDPVAV